MPKVPDVLGDATRASLVVARLATLQQQEFELKLELDMPGKGPKTLTPAVMPGEEPQAIEDRLARIKAEQEALIENNSDLASEIERLAEQRSAASAGA